MRYRSVVAVLAASIIWSPAASAQEFEGPVRRALLQHLFTANVVMRNQERIGLTDEQRRAITESIREVQSEALDARWEMQSTVSTLTEILEAPTVDEEAALAQLETLLAQERRIKRAHFRLLVRIKNALTEEQQRRLARIRREGRDGASGEPGPRRRERPGAPPGGGRDQKL